MNEVKHKTEALPVDSTAATGGAQTLEVHQLTPQELDDLKTRAAKADEHWERLLRATL